jgi:hypothetical protein
MGIEGLEGRNRKMEIDGTAVRKEALPRPPNDPEGFTIHKLGGAAVVFWWVVGGGICRTPYSVSRDVSVQNIHSVGMYSVSSDVCFIFSTKHSVCRNIPV